MNERHETQPLSPSEELALRCVEGSASPGERGELDPTMAERVRGMRRDREILISLGEEKAPAGLGERALGVLERDALLRTGARAEPDLAAMERAAAGGSIPISQVRVVREGFGWGRSLRLFGNRPGSPRMLQAAGLVLLVGGAVFWGALVLRGSGGAPLAPVLPGGRAPTIAMNTDAGGSATPMVTNESPREPVASESSATLAKAGEGDAELSAQDALALASEGRLLVRVVSASGAPAAWRAGGSDWRVNTEASPEVVAAVNEWRSAHAPARERRVEREPMAFASDSRPAPRAFVIPFRGVVSVAEALPALATPYVVNAVASPEALSAVVRSLSSTGAMVEFVRLDRPVRQDTAADPESILWWTRAPSAWVRRVNVPVIVDTR